VHFPERNLQDVALFARSARIQPMSKRTICVGSFYDSQHAECQFLGKGLRFRDNVNR